MVKEKEKEHGLERPFLRLHRNLWSSI